MNRYLAVVNYEEDISESNCIEKMQENLKNRFYISENINLIKTKHVNLSNGFFSKSFGTSKYSIMYTGSIYNLKDIKKQLQTNGYYFETKTNLRKNKVISEELLDNYLEAEILLSCFHEYKEKFLDMLNGVFSIFIYDKTEDYIFLARDRLGVKPLYYTKNNNNYIFSTNIKDILCIPEINATVDKQGALELVGLGPAHTPGITYFKDIFEILPGHYAIYSNMGLTKFKYWDLETKICSDSENTCINKIHKLVTNATNLQISDTNSACMLSGGLDSSILTTISKKTIPDLKTFSIEYENNDNDFKANSYQLSKDSDYVKIMQKYLDTNHTNISFNSKVLYNLLVPSMINRDMPGMADIDSSMLAFCSEIKDKSVDLCISGECSDEIFGGYPWFYNKKYMNVKDENNLISFPWCLSKNIRQKLINKSITNLDEYINFRYNETLENVTFLENESEENKEFRKIQYLTIKWFMNTLIERTERAATSVNLEVRMPFSDHRIFEYVYNIPYNYKLGIDKNNDIAVEKSLLKKSFKNELPDSVINRKKSPFPKTYDPKYLSLVEHEIRRIIQNKNDELFKLIDRDYLIEILARNGENLTENWFGQLMTYPQTLAYIIQIDYWINIYNIQIEI